MKYILVLGALLFSANLFLPTAVQATQKQGAFFCTTTHDATAEKPTAFNTLFKHISFFAEYVKIAIYLYCVVMGLLRITFAMFGPYIPWDKFYRIFIIFIVTLFVSTILKVYAGDKLSKVQTYVDVRRPGILFKKCERSERGSVFIPARYARKTKN